MKDTKRALRRHHYRRLKAKRVRDNYWYKCSDPSYSKQYLGICVNTPAICSCCMCCNPRRDHWLKSHERLTWQERKHLLSFKEECGTIDY